MKYSNRSYLNLNFLYVIKQTYNLERNPRKREDEKEIQRVIIIIFLLGSYINSPEDICERGTDLVN